MSEAPDPNQKPAPANLGWSMVTALVVAALVLVVWVLPAEYGLDPLGSGRLLGLSGLARNSAELEPALPSHQTQTQKFSSDQIHYQLSPFASVEYKYQMAEGQTLVYQWQATGELVFDLHSEQQGSDPEDATSFSTGRSTSQIGSYTAPYSGIHGWFWENRGSEAVSFSLSTVGFINGAVLYEGGFANPRPLTPLLSPP